MTMSLTPTMTPEAKGALSKTIRALRERLLADLDDAMVRAYKLGTPVAKARLDDLQSRRRARLDAWVDEQVRADGTVTKPEKRAEAAKRFRHDVVKRAAYTLLNRVVYLRLLEASGLRKVPLVTGGWSARGYQDFRDLAPDLTGDETEGYAHLLGLVFDELALDLPGLYGSAGIADLVPTPAATLRHLIETLDDPQLESCWTDDMTLGWVYQYWNDPRSSPTRSPARPRCSPSATWWTGCSRTPWVPCGWRCVESTVGPRRSKPMACSTSSSTAALSGGPGVRPARWRSPS